MGFEPTMLLTQFGLRVRRRRPLGYSPVTILSLFVLSMVPSSGVEPDLPQYERGVLPLGDGVDVEPTGGVQPPS